MTFVGIALVFGVAVCGLALRANRRLQGVERLPMQWWFTGAVTWSAPRPLALAFIPALAICVFAGLTLLALNVRPRAGQEGMVLPIFVGVGLLFLGIQLLHLWLVGKSLRRDGR